ncbi:MAG: M48 family metalloprotease [Myxococcota bacterium]
MNRSLILIAALNLTTGCALFHSATGGKLAAATNTLEAAGGEAAQIVKDGQARAKAKCDPIRTAEVAWVEERAMGGVVSVQQVSRFGNLVLDGFTEEEPAPLLQRVKDSEKDASKKLKLPDSAKNDLTAYVSVVGRNLARYSARPEIPWTFAVIENDTPNAFSAPGGYVVVTTGLLRKMTNEAQLAGVLAHEIGHVVHKHSIKRYRDAKATQCDIATFGGYVVGKGLQAAVSMLPADAREAAKFAKDFENFDLDKADGGFVVFVMDAVMKLIEAMGNEKEDEFQADATALELVAFAGYDASEYETFLTSLGDSGGGFSKHPSTGERVSKLKALRTGDLAPFATGTAKPDVSKAFAPIKK